MASGCRPYATCCQWTTRPSPVIRENWITPYVHRNQPHMRRRTQMTVSLASFRNNRAIHTRPFAFRAIWRLLGLPLLRSSLLYGTHWRVLLLQIFGAHIGEGVQIKTGVRVTTPWLLKIGEHSWIGEDCWIDNMAMVTIGNNVCISQGVYLCTGNHDWKDPAFRMFAMEITLADGCWIASRSVLAPGVTVGRNAIAGIGSVVSSSIPADLIYSGNPAIFKSIRTFTTPLPTEQFARAISLQPPACPDDLAQSTTDSSPTNAVSETVELVIPL
ncbi:MAG: transferase hexapeptide repeat containing protein [Acidobacteriaceae bacterium]|nr:transferase hexapeptide repeat containing protein [Acidobacteriaceae bacterium]